MSELKRAQGLCPLTPEETALILQALDFDKETQIYIAAGEMYGGERRLAALRAAFPRTVSLSRFLAFLIVLWFYSFWYLLCGLIVVRRMTFFQTMVSIFIFLYVCLFVWGLQRPASRKREKDEFLIFLCPFLVYKQH